MQELLTATQDRSKWRTMSSDMSNTLPPPTSSRHQYCWDSAGIGEGMNEQMDEYIVQIILSMFHDPPLMNRSS